MRTLLAILLFPLLVSRRGGMWQASSVGITLNHRGESMSLRLFLRDNLLQGLMTLVAWRYQLIGPTPSGLRVRLCLQSRCVELEGRAEPPWPFRYSGSRTLRFIWEVPAVGG